MKYDIGDTRRYLEIQGEHGDTRGSWIYRGYLEIQVVSGDTVRYLEIQLGTQRYRKVLEIAERSC